MYQARRSLSIPYGDGVPSGTIGGLPRKDQLLEIVPALHQPFAGFIIFLTRERGQGVTELGNGEPRNPAVDRAEVTLAGDEGPDLLLNLLGPIRFPGLASCEDIGAHGVRRRL